MKKHIARGVYLLIFVLAAVLLLVMYRTDQREAGSGSRNLRQIEFQGTFHTEDAKTERELTEDALAQAGAAEWLTMTGHFTEDIEKNEQIFFFLRRISVRVYQNGELIYSCGEPREGFSLAYSAGSIWSACISAGIYKEDVITLEFHNPYPRNSAQIYRLFMKQLYVGDKMGLFRHMVQEHLPVIFFCILIFLMGFVFVISALTLKAMKIQYVDSVLHCGALFLVFSLWLLIDYSYISLLIPLGRTLDYLDTLVFISVLPMAIHYIRDYTRDRQHGLLIWTEYGLLGGNLIYLILQGMGIIDGEYMQEIYMRVLPVIIVLLFCGAVTELRKSPKKDARMVLFSGMLLLLFGAVVYTWYQASNLYGVSLFGVGLILFMLIQYVVAVNYIWSAYQEAKRARQMEKELMESRIAIMMSQIQPHFLYNSISSIQELCLEEPRKAYDALAQFAHFLRGNMDSIASKKPIPFEQEMRHVKNYLALEKIRFEDRLSVQYDFEEEGFFLPALTIQPLVENAVRYGLSKKKSGGTVTISTRRVENEIVIMVEDNGVGFDVDQLGVYSDQRSHIGLENVKNRLESQCGGRMEIESQIGEGTVIKIMIPVAG